jgi:hypothetical protein
MVFACSCTPKHTCGGRSWNWNAAEYIRRDVYKQMHRNGMQESGKAEGRRICIHVCEKACVYRGWLDALAHALINKDCEKKRACMLAYPQTHTHSHTYTHTRAHANTHTHAHAHTHTHPRTNTHTHTHTNTHAHTHMHTHTHTHTHTRTYVWT